MNTDIYIDPELDQATVDDLLAKAQQGITLFDRLHPGWASRVRTKLDMMCGCNCVAAQIAGMTFREASLTDFFQRHDVVTIGVYIEPKGTGSAEIILRKKKYQILTLEWQKAIDQRLQSATTGGAEAEPLGFMESRSTENVLAVALV